MLTANIHRLTQLNPHARIVDMSATILRCPPEGSPCTDCQVARDPDISLRTAQPWSPLVELTRSAIPVIFRRDDL